MQSYSMSFYIEMYLSQVIAILEVGNQNLVRIFQEPYAPYMHSCLIVYRGENGALSNPLKFVWPSHD